MRKAFHVVSQSCSILKRHPLFAFPFVLLALLEGIALYLLFLAPQEPFAKLLAPPIARFWGDQFVHYPGHLFLLPRLFYYAKLLLSFMPGMFVSAYFIGLIADVKLKRKTSRRYRIKTALHRFFALFIIWGFGMGVLKLVEILYTQAAGWGDDSKVYLTSLQFLVFFLSFWAQILFLYALPLVILAGQSLFGALIGNFRYLKRLFLPTTFCIFLAAFLYLGLYIFEKDLVGLAARTSPEIIVVVLAVSIPLTMVINLLMTTATTLLFIDEQETDPQVSIVTGKGGS